MARTTIMQNPTSLSVRSVSLQDADALWHAFNQRVEPLVRVMYRWALEELRTKSTHSELQTSLSGTKNALISAIYYVSAHSLTDEESLSRLQQPRSELVAECQARCEDALLCTNLFCISDIDVIKAIIFYTVRFHTCSYGNVD